MKTRLTALLLFSLGCFSVSSGRAAMLQHCDRQAPVKSEAALPQDENKTSLIAGAGASPDRPLGEVQEMAKKKKKKKKATSHAS
jgi:hypothetical protein